MRPVAPARRRIPDIKAGALARWVSRASDERLDSVMRGRLRGILMWQVFRTMRQRVDRQRAKGIDAVVEFRVAGRRDGGIDRYQVAIADGRCMTSRRGTGEPAVTLGLGPVAFLRMVGGDVSGPRLLIAGRLKLRGDLLLAARLPRVLNVPKWPR